MSDLVVMPPVTLGSGLVVQPGATLALGPTGPAATVTVGTTTTLAAGAAATVANSGTSGAAVLNFGVPQGPPSPAATTTTTGTVTLAGDLGGTAGAPTVPGLAGKVGKVTGLIPNDSSSATKTTNAAVLAAAFATGRAYIPGAGVTYYTNEVAITGPLDVAGESITTSLRNDSGSVLVLSGSFINLSTLTLRSDGGNHTVRQSGAIDQGRWDRFRLYQLGSGYSAWDNGGYGIVDMRFANFLSWGTQTATVPTWNLVGAGGTINGNVWQQFRAQFSGNYHFWVATSDVGSQHANVWRDASWEVTTGGLVKLVGCRDYIIENSAIWDLSSGSGGVTTLQRHGIWADTNASSASCVGTIRNHRRLDSSCAATIQDIMLPSSFRGDGTVLENCRAITPSNPMLVDLNSNVCRVMTDGPTASILATISNATVSTVIDRTGITLPTNQSLKVGTALVGYGLAQVNVLVDPASIPANSELDVSFTVTGALTTDACSVSPGFYLDLGLGIMACWVSAANTVTMRLRNSTGAAIDSAAHTWRVRIWR